MRLRRLLPAFLVAASLAVGAVLPVGAAGKAGVTLPKLPSTALPPPAPDDTKALDELLKLYASGKTDDRKAADERAKEDGAKLVPAMAKRLAELRKSMNRDNVGTVIEEARKGRKKPSKKDKDETPSDWLELLLARQKDDAAWKDAFAVVVIERTLVAAGTTAAGRELVNVYFYFGDLFRIDAQIQVVKMGERAVPALIEGRKHDVEKVRRWSSKQLDTLGKAIPGEAVQVQDPDVLADVLRAYGRAKDIDALRVITSFTSSDRANVRNAAREALVSFGEAALWQLREALESTTGKRPPAGTPWDKLAEELFAAHDRARLDEIIDTFEEGLKKHKEGDLDEMAKAYDAVLARAPTFDRRSEMVQGYLDLAKKLDGKDRKAALLHARKAERLDPDGAQAKAIKSYVLTLEAEDMNESGLADTATLKRALLIDPSNERAKKDLAAVEAHPGAVASPTSRYLAAGAVGLVALVGAVLLGLGGRAKRPPGGAPAEHPAREPRPEVASTAEPEASAPTGDGVEGPDQGR